MTKPFSSPLKALEIEDSKDPNNDRMIVYPEDEIRMIDHWVTFTAYETKQLDRKTPTEEQQKNSITLPMPMNLATAYQMQYADTDLGAFGQILVDALGNNPSTDINRELLARLAVGGALGAAATGGSAQGFGVGAAGAGAYDLLSNENSQVAGAALSTASQGLGGVGQAILANQGIARNPHKVLLFQGVGFREHQFNYQFTPKSFQEAQRIREIIKLFKLYGSPSFDAGTVTVPLGRAGIDGVNDFSRDLGQGKHFFKYPDYFKIKFHDHDFLFGIGPSVLESITVDYQPAGQATWARSKGNPSTPTQINVTMMFKETEIITKENIEDYNR